MIELIIPSSKGLNPAAACSWRLRRQQKR